METQNFFNGLMQHIMEGRKIPKVQVERTIGPILGYFLPEIMEKYFENRQELSGEYKLVSPEFPLKKEENNQSTNIDFLLVNNSQKLLVFFELKTDDTFVNNSQMAIYENHKRKVSLYSAQILRDELSIIARGSHKYEKYDYIISKFDKIVKNPLEIRRSIIVYLTPSSMKRSLVENSKVDVVLSFGDLPREINSEFSEYWEIIVDNLAVLDENGTIQTEQLSEIREVRSLNELYDNYSLTTLAKIVNNIKRFLANRKDLSEPLYIKLGLTGEGAKPNYQVYFPKGKIVPFYYSGKEYKRKPFFKEGRLGEKILWENIKTLA